MTGQLWWYVARASGIVGWCLLAASVVWGLALSTKTRPPRVRPNWLLDLHRFLGGLATIFSAVHVTGIVADSYTHFGPTDVLIPLAANWRPGAVAWGVVSMYMLAAVELTSLARARLPRRAWRTIHLASFPLFATSTVHAITAGTDTANPVFRIAVWTVSLVVVALTARRLHQQVATTTAPRPHDVRPVHPSPGLRSSTPPTAPPMRSVPGPPVPPARSTPVLTGPPARPRGSPRAGAARSRAGVGTTTTGPRT